MKIKNIRENNLAKEVKRLHKDVSNLQEKTKLLQKRLDFTQDELVKVAIEKQAIIQSVSYIMTIGIELAKREGIIIEGAAQQGAPVTPELPDKTAQGGHYQ